jgi:phage terminase large subunit GpA-like protein
MSDAFRQAIKPPTMLAASDWVMRNVLVAGSDRSACYDLSQYRWWIDPINELQNHDTRKIICVAPTGAGKSTMMTALLCYIAAEDAGTLMYASQSDSKAKFFGETKAIPTMKSCSALDGYWSSDRHKTRNSEIIMPHMWLKFKGANFTNFQEDSCRYLLGDEPWRWESGLIKEFFARHHDRSNRKGYLVSQGAKTKSDFHREALKGEQMQYSWQCQSEECQSWNAYNNDDIQVREIKGEDGELDITQTKRTAVMVCPSCGNRHADILRTRRQIADTAKYISTRPATEEGTVTYNFPRSAMWWIDWGEVWQRKHEAQMALQRGIAIPMMQYCNKDEALFWDEDFALEPPPLTMGGYLKGDMTDAAIEGEAMRVMSLDRGKNHYWHIVIAWTSDGYGHVLSEGYCNDETDVLLIQKRLGVQHVVCDVSWEMDDSMAICVRNGWTGIRGDQLESFSARLPNGKIVSRSYSVPKRYTAYGKTGKYISVSSKVFKDMMQGLREAGRIILPDDVSESYKAHMESEHKRVVTNARTGAETSIWMQIKRKPNHLLDCLYYNVAVAYMAGFLVKLPDETQTETAENAGEKES